jgi:hypothetical protein
MKQVTLDALFTLDALLGRSVGSWNWERSVGTFDLPVPVVRTVPTGAEENRDLP